MTRSELVLKLSSLHKDLSSSQIESIVHFVFDGIAKALKEGGRVELRGFGTFSLRQREARMGRNPRTGQSVEVDGKAVPFFKTGKELRHLLNDSQRKG